MQNVLHIHSTDVSAVIHALTMKRDESPEFFLHSPIVIDCKKLNLDDETLDFKTLLNDLRELSFVPVGIRHLPTEIIQLATNSGWAVLRSSNAKHVPIKTRKKTEHVEQSKSNTEEQTDHSDMMTNRVIVINRPIRSGQQVYSADGDIVVLSQTGAGSEVLADGSIHVYGKISGRVLAGVNGDRSARIFCQGLEAELIAIAGSYQLLDELDSPLKGQPAMISLDGGKLKIESMV